MPSKKTDALIVVAHPDDETLFFGGLIQAKPYRWHVVCVTDGNGDGRGEQRSFEYITACKKLGVTHPIQLKFPDKFGDRLDVKEIQNQLRGLDFPKFKYIFTHGVLGEYQHRHHQDVSYAVHELFGDKLPVYSVAYNIFPDLRIQLTESQFRKKGDVLSRIYSQETQRFQNLIPLSYVEGFSRVRVKEVRHLYQWLLGNEDLDSSGIRHYKWLIPYLKAYGGVLKERLF